MGECAVVRLLGGARQFSCSVPPLRVLTHVYCLSSSAQESYRLPSVRANSQHPGALRLDRVYSASASRLVALGPRVRDGRMNSWVAPQLFINASSAESVVEFWLRQVSKCVINGYLPVFEA